MNLGSVIFFFFKQKTAYELRISDWSSDVCSSDLYGQHTGKFAGHSQLGLLTISTDEGIDGHAFLGSASRGAQMDGESLIHYLKPIVMGQDPLDREDRKSTRLNSSH